ncbi:MAG: Crp/Fnr family transcriptional regulator [Bacteroidales bacterium]|nr:Crp/Fnr family transcriptional regulator [Bacteroidales bacterium]
MNKMQDLENCKNCNCKTSIFKSLSTEELEQINKGRYTVNYKAGEILFKQGTPSPHFVCLTKGLAKLYIEGYGKNLILSLVKPVDYIFGPGTYVDNRHYYSAAAVEDTTACLVDVNIFKQLVRENPDFAEEFICRVSRQAIFNFDQVVSLTQKQMPGRIADVLFYLRDKIYEKNPFEISISRQDLADLSGMSKESSIRILKELKDEGILRITGNTIEILNEKQLRQISQTG